MNTVHQRTVPGRTEAPASHDLKFEEKPRATLAAVQLPTDLTLDAEGPALIARVPGVRLRLQKVDLDGEALDLRNYSTGAGRVGRAAATLRPAGSIDVVGLACTSLAFALGRDHVQEELREAHPGAAVTDMATAVLAALEHLGAKRPALLTPYLDELHSRNLALLTAAGLDVVSHRNLGLVTDAEITAISQASIREHALAVDHADADVVVIGCSAFRVCTPGFIDELEETLHKPVISSQQAFLWHLLRLAGVDDLVGGYGGLLAGRTTAALEGHDAAPPARPVDDSAAADRFFDVYPSRVETPGLIDRIDPIVDEARRCDGPLRANQLEEYDRRGVLVMRQAFSPEEVEVLRSAANGLRGEYEAMTYDELDQVTDMRVITERGGSLVSGHDERPTLKSIWQIHVPPEDAPHMRSAASISRRTICDSRLVDAARQILGEEVYVHQSRINYQTGWNEHNQGGSGFLWHQDFEQWHCEDGMPRMRAVSMAVLLERAVPANGALMVMPGSHRRLVQAYGDPTERGSYAKGALSRGPLMPASLLRELADHHGIEHCRGEPGDVVMFDCNTIHGSHTNISPWGRCMFFAVYNVVSNTPAPKPYGVAEARPEHIGSHDPRWAGVPLPSLPQALTERA